MSYQSKTNTPNLFLINIKLLILFKYKDLLYIKLRPKLI